MTTNGISILLKRLKCTIFCDEPFELMDHVEFLEEGTFGLVKCPKCGLVYSILNKRDSKIK